MITIYPEKDCVLRNKVNGVFSFMASTSHSENWENVDIAEYEAWKAEQVDENAEISDYENALSDLGVRFGD